MASVDGFSKQTTHNASSWNFFSQIGHDGSEGQHAIYEQAFAQWDYSKQKQFVWYWMKNVLKRGITNIKVTLDTLLLLLQEVPWPSLLWHVEQNTWSSEQFQMYPKCVWVSTGFCLLHVVWRLECLVYMICLTLCVWVYVGVYICVCVYVYVCVCLCAYICMYIYMNAYVYVDTYVYVYIYIYVFIYIKSHVSTPEL